MTHGDQRKPIYDKSNTITNLIGQNEDLKSILVRLNSCSDLFLDLNEKDPASLAFKALMDLDKGGIQKFSLRNHVIEEMARLRDAELVRYLRYRYGYDVFPKDKILSEYPPLVQIEPASICNYRCVFCYQTDERLTCKKDGQMGMMSLETFKKIIDQLEGNVEAITLASRGEPTVNPKLPDMLQYMSGKFLAVKLNTNASLLTDKLSRAILESDIQTLVISADAATEPLYSKLRVNGNLTRVLKNVKRFNEIKDTEFTNSRIITRVSGVKYSDDQNIESQNNVWGSLVDQVAFVQYNPWENAYDAEYSGVDTPCSDLWRRMFLWWDGRVAVCDVDYLTKLIDDNISSDSIKNLWSGETYSLLRSRHMLGERNKLEPCSRCVVT